MLIAEDVLLLLLDDEKGTFTASYVGTALGGGVLVELALDGAVEVAEKSRRWSAAKIEIVPGHKPLDPTLAGAYATIAEKRRSASDLVVRLGKGLPERLADGMVARGLLRRDDRRVLGVLPRRRWLPLDPAPKLAMRHRLSAVLVSGATPDERTAAVVALLSAVDRAHKVVDTGGIGARTVRRRAKEIADGDWAAKGVRDAIAAAQAGIIAATTAASTAAVSST